MTIVLKLISWPLRVRNTYSRNHYIINEIFSTSEKSSGTQGKVDRLYVCLCIGGGGGSKKLVSGIIGRQILTRV